MINHNKNQLQGQNQHSKRNKSNPKQSDHSKISSRHYIKHLTSKSKALVKPQQQTADAITRTMLSINRLDHNIGAGARRRGGQGKRMPAANVDDAKEREVEAG